MSIKYTKEFKEEAAKLVTEHGYSQAEAGRRLGVSDKNINRWVKESKTPREIKEPITGEQEELKRLRKEVAQLRLEHEILKKAAAFFAREQK
jgi:transposase